VSVLLVTDERFLDHVAGRSHPERPARLTAVLDGIAAAGLDDALVRRAPSPVADVDLFRVHPAGHVESFVDLDSAGGGRLDPDTVMGPGSWLAARLAAGAGLVAIDGLRNGDADVAIPVERGQRVSDSMSGPSTFVVVPGAGHSSNLEAPDLVNPAMLEFLAGLD
jgi:acetoin utilization deacetylase AcuC-like enzyme